VVYTAPDGMLSAGSTSSPRLVAGPNTFTLVATHDQDTAMKELTVTAQDAPKITSFLATPSMFVGATAQVTVTWSVANPATVTLKANGQPAPGFMPSTAGS